MIAGARTVRFVSNHAWQGVKKLLKLMWDIFKIFGLIIAYFVVRNIEVTNTADINRKEFSLNIWNDFIIAVIAFVILTWLMVMLDTFLRRHWRSVNEFGRKYEGPLTDLFFVGVVLVGLSVSMVVATAFWKGVYINSELAPEESEAPTQSNFILLFYWFCLLCLIIAQIIPFGIFCAAAIGICIWSESSLRNRAYGRMS